MRGATLTCASTTTTTSTATCNGPKINGLDVRLDFPEATAICNFVTGQSFISASGSGTAANPHVIWNGTTWALSSVSATPMLNINCNR
ncbi:hypothetical protein [Streptomyces sp. HUAS TT20]|uniref:hypothetical protein n=1 Tax=Streptomyces sp. HUAS TT20 TaxID=3447509 RepID=UPI0021D8ADD6|nr:hypothetical protein [Streptomyces sp. HUAS 15-9]UXY28523.1 hypothetical protein N8I87_19460 [Streptomyces sp. HUAS 15-9]